MKRIIHNRAGNTTAKILNTAGVSPGATLSAQINYTLSDFASGHMNDTAKLYEFAERLCPTVAVPGAHGQWKAFDDINSFQAYTTARAMGADPTRIQFAAEDEYYNCAPQALEITVDEKEREDAGKGNAVAQQLLDEGKIKALVNAALLSYANTRTTFVLNNLTAVANRGNFGNPNIDPIDQIDEQIDQLAQVCGSMENIKITMSLDAWRAIRSNAKSKFRLIGNQIGEITLQQFMDALLFPCDTKVYSLSYIAPPGTGPPGGGNYAGTQEPAAGVFTTKSRLLSGNIIIHYSVPNPTLYDPSAFKSFCVGGNTVQAVRSWMALNGLYGGHLVDWSEDVVQTSSIGARRLTLS
jgi:hypothetical protein